MHAVIRVRGSAAIRVRTPPPGRLSGYTLVDAQSSDPMRGDMLVEAPGRAR